MEVDLSFYFSTFFLLPFDDFFDLLEGDFSAFSLAFLLDLSTYSSICVF